MTSKLSLLLILALSVVGLTATVAMADEYTCRGALGAVTHDNVHAPDGSRCTMTGTTVKGSIVVGTGSTLTADRVCVDGNIQAEGARNVVVRDSRIGGSVQIKQGRAASILRNVIDGNL